MPHTSSASTASTKRAAQPTAKPAVATSLPKAATAPALNLGRTSLGWLAQCGIHGLDDLRRLGSVAAYRLVRSRQPRASLNLLWALEGALQGRHWTDIKRSDGTRLLLELGE